MTAAAPHLTTLAATGAGHDQLPLCRAVCRRESLGLRRLLVVMLEVPVALSQRTCNDNKELHATANTPPCSGREWMAASNRLRVSVLHAEW